MNLLRTLFRRNSVKRYQCEFCKVRHANERKMYSYTIATGVGKCRDCWDKGFFA